MVAMRLRRATTMETGLFEIQAEHLSEFRRARQVHPATREVVYAMFGRSGSVSFNRDAAPQTTRKRAPYTTRSSARMG
jgi:hypothetical protein